MAGIEFVYHIDFMANRNGEKQEFSADHSGSCPNPFTEMELQLAAVAHLAKEIGVHPRDIEVVSFNYSTLALS